LKSQTCVSKGKGLEVEKDIWTLYFPSSEKEKILGMSVRKKKTWRRSARGESWLKGEEAPGGSLWKQAGRHSIRCERGKVAFSTRLVDEGGATGSGRDARVTAIPPEGWRKRAEEPFHYPMKTREGGSVRQEEKN